MHAVPGHLINSCHNAGGPSVSATIISPAQVHTHVNQIMLTLFLKMTK